MENELEVIEAIDEKEIITEECIYESDNKK